MSEKALLITSTVIISLLLVAATFGMLYYGQQYDAVEDEVLQAKRQNHTLREQNVYLQKRIEELNIELARNETPTEDSTPVEKEAPTKNESQQKEPEQKPVETSPGGSGSIVYLTFDDGPSKNTISILRILKQHNIEATFFVTGNNVSGDDTIYRRIVNDGHILGNHTFSHDFESIYQSPEDFLTNFIELEEFLYAETGVQTDIMRFPGGSKSAMAQKTSGYDIVSKLIPEVKDLGYDYFDWNVSSGDGISTPPSKEIVENVLRGANRVNGDIVVLFHDSRTKNSTVEALPEIIEELTAKGYNFAPLNPGAISVKHK